MNERAFQKYLATGEYVPTEDAAPTSLEAHDRKFHPDGYKEGDSCKFRESMAKKDDSDKLSSDGGVTNESQDPYKAARELGYMGGRENAARWLSEPEAQRRKETMRTLLSIAKGDKDKARDFFEEIDDMRSLGMMTTTMADIDKFAQELGDSPEAKAVVQQLKAEKQKQIDRLNADY